VAEPVAAAQARKVPHFFCSSRFVERARESRFSFKSLA
jgi:hypothetical protein